VLEKELPIRNRIVRENPTDRQAKKELLGCLNRVAGAQALLGRDGDSLQSFEHALAIARPLASANPTDRDVRRLMGTLLTGYGLGQDRVNWPARALRSFQECLTFLEAQARDQPDVVTWQFDLADGYRGLGTTLESVGQPAQALLSLRTSRHAASSRSWSRTFPESFAIARLSTSATPGLPASIARSDAGTRHSRYWTKPRSCSKLCRRPGPPIITTWRAASRFASHPPP
jgi:hypothetical protein